MIIYLFLGCCFFFFLHFSLLYMCPYFTLRNWTHYYLMIMKWPLFRDSSAPVKSPVPGFPYTLPPSLSLLMYGATDLQSRNRPRSTFLLARILISASYLWGLIGQRACQSRGIDLWLVSLSFSSSSSSLSPSRCSAVWHVYACPAQTLLRFYFISAQKFFGRAFNKNILYLYSDPGCKKTAGGGSVFVLVSRWD